MKETSTVPIVLNVTSRYQPCPDAPVALLIHGLGASSKSWSRLAKNLFDEGYTVHCPDLPGHGKSPTATVYSTELWSEAILNLNLQPDIVIGHSIGGLLAANIQVKLKSKTLVLVDPVFSIPGSKFFLPLIRFSFAHTVKTSHKFSPRNSFKQNLKGLLTKTPYVMWDPKTVSALSPNPKTIIQQLTNKAHTVVLVRPKGSVILPQKVFRKVSGFTNIYTHTFTRGHNSYFFHHDKLWEILKTYLTKGETNVTDILSGAAEM